MSDGEAFQFKFNQPEATSEMQEDDAEPSPRAPAEELVHRPQAISTLEFDKLTITDDLELLKGQLTGDEAAHILQDPRASTTDLIPGKYEGGFKLWECSLDLCRFFLTKYGVSPAALLKDPELETSLRGKKCLELGCGHGMPGIVALMAGAEVHFQDYNKEVLTSLTMPNVIANMQRLPQARPRPSTRYFAGDWGSVGEHLTGRGYGGHYDIILTAETIYNEKAQQRLLECIKQLIQPPHGVAYVAAKSYYFGVGGGTASFKSRVQADGIFEVVGVFKAEDVGSGVVREVLQLKFPESISPYFL